jgi:hypothetical protein
VAKDEFNDNSRRSNNRRIDEHNDQRGVSHKARFAV